MGHSIPKVYYKCQFGVHNDKWTGRSFRAVHDVLSILEGKAVGNLNLDVTGNETYRYVNLGRMYSPTAHNQGR